MTHDEQRGKSVRAALLVAIADHFEQKGCSPSVRELAKMVGVRSHSTVLIHLQRMRAEGFIRYDDHMKRTITIAKPYIYHAHNPEAAIVKSTTVMSKWGPIV